MYICNCNIYISCVVVILYLLKVVLVLVEFIDNLDSYDWFKLVNDVFILLLFRLLLKLNWLFIIGEGRFLVLLVCMRIN